MCTACWSTFGASLPSVCVVTYLQRCGDYRPNSTLWTLHHGSVTLSTMQVDQCWPGWMKNARTTRNIVPLHTAVRIRSQVSAPRPIRRAVVTQDDTDNGIIGMHDSTMHDATLFRRKKWCLKGTAGRGQVICFGTRASAAIGRRTISPSQPSRVKNLLAPRSDFKTNLAAVPKRRDRRPSPVHSRSTLKPSSSRTQQRLRISGDLIADAGQQRLVLAQQFEQQRQRRRTRPWSGQKQTPKTAAEVQKAHPQVPRDGSGKPAWLLEVPSAAPTTVSRHRRHLERFLQWADDDGRELREDDAVDSALVEFLNHRVFLGLQAWEGEKILAALLFIWPEFGRCGGRKIPRSWRCVKGWRRVTQGKSRKPHHLSTWQGIEGLRLTRINVSPPVAGVSDFWSLLSHPGQGLQ